MYPISTTFHPNLISDFEPSSSCNFEGMCPTSSFLERFSEDSIVRFSNCSGIFPSSLFEDRSNHSRFIKFLNDGGI
ncbi:hypothetical protein QQP08_020846 [Theobroma cacao]|nr:hypothetical protein QQP08_020846 [Theobroma cacao]